MNLDKYRKQARELTAEWHALRAETAAKAIRWCKHQMETGSYPPEMLSELRKLKERATEIRARLVRLKEEIEIALGHRKPFQGVEVPDVLPEDLG